MIAELAIKKCEADQDKNLWYGLEKLILTLCETSKCCRRKLLKYYE
ncbi:hypothetical protein VCHA29O37_100107 [Vibrio chagasii]|nr:hypothetical protein VCHA29O37_100107 [Vibrio chagasii]